MYAFKVCERKTSGLVEVIIPQPAYHVGPRSARPRNPLGGGGWIRPWSWQDVKKQNLTKENLHLNTPPPPTHTHTHTFTTRLGHFLDPVRDHFSASSYQNRSPMSMLETPRIKLHVFYSFNFQDCSLCFRSCFNLSSCIQSHCHSITFSLFFKARRAVNLPKCPRGRRQCKKKDR